MDDFSGKTCNGRGPIEETKAESVSEKKSVKDEYDSVFSRIMNWITLKTGVRPNTYSIFVWMRQVNYRLIRLETRQVEGVVAERAEFEAFVESLKDKMDARIDTLEQRVDELEGKILEMKPDIT